MVHPVSILNITSCSQHCNYFCQLRKNWLIFPFLFLYTTVAFIADEPSGWLEWSLPLPFRGRGWGWLTNIFLGPPCPLRMRITLAFLLYLGTSPVLHDFLKRMDSDLAASASSLNTHGYTPSRPLDLCMFSLPSWSLIQPSLTKGKSFFLQSSVGR